MPHIRNVKYDNQIVEQPVYNGTKLTRWIHDGIVVWENGGNFKDVYVVHDTGRDPRPLYTLDLNKDIKHCLTYRFDHPAAYSRNTVTDAYFFGSISGDKRVKISTGPYDSEEQQFTLQNTYHDMIPMGTGILGVTGESGSTIDDAYFYFIKYDDTSKSMVETKICSIKNVSTITYGPAYTFEDTTSLSARACYPPLFATEFRCAFLAHAIVQRTDTEHWGTHVITQYRITRLKPSGATELALLLNLSTYPYYPYHGQCTFWSTSCGSLYIHENMGSTLVGCWYSGLSWSGGACGGWFVWVFIHENRTVVNYRRNPNFPTMKINGTYIDSSGITRLDVTYTNIGEYYVGFDDSAICYDRSQNRYIHYFLRRHSSWSGDCIIEAGYTREGAPEDYPTGSITSDGVKSYTMLDLPDYLYVPIKDKQTRLDTGYSGVYLELNSNVKRHIPVDENGQQVNCYIIDVNNVYGSIASASSCENYSGGICYFDKEGNLTNALDKVLYISNTTDYTRQIFVLLDNFEFKESEGNLVINIPTSYHENN